MNYRVTFHTTFIVTEEEWRNIREGIGIDPDVTFDERDAEDEAAYCFESVYGFFPNVDNWAATVEKVEEDAQGATTGKGWE
jgi:hypothetical protein